MQNVVKGDLSGQAPKLTEQGHCSPAVVHKHRPALLKDLMKLVTWSPAHPMQLLLCTAVCLSRGQGLSSVVVVSLPHLACNELKVCA
jgi:hypothetical protein